MKYADIEALNWSSLKLIETSEAYARHMWEHPEERKDTPAFALGRAIHCAVLEPDVFTDRYIVPPEFCDCAITPGGKVIPQPIFGDLRYKGPKEQRTDWIHELPKGSRLRKKSEFKSDWLAAVPDGVDVISQDTRDLSFRCREAIQKNKNAMGLLDGAETEKIIEWELSNVRCKGRMDAVNTSVSDLKTTRYFSKRDLEREAVRLNYHALLAWYHDGAVAKGLIDGKTEPSIIFLCINPDISFIDVAVFQLTNGTLDAGRSYYKNLLSRYIGAKVTGVWPGVASRKVEWTLPDWKIEDDYDF